MSVKKSILSFTTYLPSPIIPKENDITLRIYEGLDQDHVFTIYKSLNILPIFSARYSDYKKLKKEKVYKVRSKMINVYTMPDFKDSLRIKSHYFYWIYKCLFNNTNLGTYDLIHSNNIFPDFFMGFYTSKKIGVPHVCTVRGKKKQVTDFLQLDKKYFVNTYFTTPDPAVIELFEKKKIPIVFVPHGIDDIFYINDFSKINKTRTFRFIIVNRLIEMKQINIIIDFFHYFKTCGHSFLCDIIGDGDQNEVLISQVKRLNLSNEITFLGHQDKEFVSQRLKNADFYFTNSKSETFGLSIVEALASGCLIVAPKHIGVVNLFNDREFFIEFTSNFEFVMDVIVKKNKSISELKVNANLYAMDFRWDTMLEKYKNAFSYAFDKKAESKYFLQKSNIQSSKNNV